MLLSPAEPRSICGTVVSSSPLWCNISIATNSAAVGATGGAVVHKTHALLRLRAKIPLSPGTPVRKPERSGRLLSMDGRFWGQSVTTRA